MMVKTGKPFERLTKVFDKMDKTIIKLLDMINRWLDEYEGNADEILMIFFEDYYVDQFLRYIDNDVIDIKVFNTHFKTLQNKLCELLNTWEGNYKPDCKINTIYGPGVAEMVNEFMKDHGLITHYR